MHLVKASMSLATIKAGCAMQTTKDIPPDSRSSVGAMEYAATD